MIYDRLKPEQLENYIAQLQGFRNTYQSLLTVLASDRQNFEFKPGCTKLPKYTSDVNEVTSLTSEVQSHTFEYRDLTNLLNGHDANSESGINLIEATLKTSQKTTL